MGITADNIGGAGVVAVWPENRQAVTVFLAMQTQWRSGLNGLSGLDYGALPEVWRRTKTPPQDRDRVFFELRLIEIAALNEMHKAD